jgi:uncharacterized protein YjdB
MGRRVGSWFVLAAGALAATAVPGGSLSAQSGVRELQIAPVQVELQVGERKSVLVTAFDRDGNVIPTVDLKVSAEPRVINVQQDASAPNVLYVEGVGYGVTSLTVKASGVVASASVRVADARSGSSLAGPSGTGVATVLQINPPTIYLLPTEEVQVAVSFLKDDGSPAARGAVTWSSLLGTVASVDNSGKVVGISPGQGVVQVTTSSGLTARALVQVQNTALAFASRAASVATLQSISVPMVVPEQGNREVDSRSLVWASSDPRIINVSPVGQITGIAPGRADVIVTGFGQQVRLPVTVHQPVETMIVSPSQGEIPVQLGGYVSFEARFTAADGSEVPEARATWTIEDTTVASVDPLTGKVTGNKLGLTTLKALGPGGQFTATWSIRVVTGGISLSARRIGVSKGAQPDLVANFMDTNGDILGAATGVQWSSSDPSVATVDQSGKVMAVGWGHATVVAATSWGGGDSAAVFVQGDLLVTSTRTGDGDIYGVDLSDLESLVRITSTSGAEVASSYSPDGTRIAYIATSDAGADVHVMNADGSNPQRLTFTNESEGGPQWTPDGSHIVYQVTTRRESSIWIMGADGSEPKPLTNTSQWNDQPTVSPDGASIAYRATVQGDRSLYVMDIEGENPRPLTQPDGDYRAPRWLADGRVAYLVDRRVDRQLVRSLEFLDPATGDSEHVDTAGLWINEFAVSHDGKQVAAIVQEQVGNKQVLRLVLIDIHADGTLSTVEVPRLGEDEMFLFPAYRP